MSGTGLFLRRRIVALAIIAALLPAPRGHAADPQPYAATLVPTGIGPLDAALRDSSNLLGLAEAPAGPFALVTRARGDVSRLETALNSFGYYAGQVRIQVAGRPVDDPALPSLLEDAPASPPVPITLSVETGPQFHLRRVETTGAPQGYSLDLQPGAPARAADVLAARDKLLANLRGAGYALAKVDAPAATLEPAAEALDVAVRVEPGPRVDLGAISIEGLDRVRESYVRRRLLVHEGERFDPAEIERARQDLATLGVFSTVGARAAERLDPEGRLPLAFEVAERPRRAVGFNAAYSTDLGASVGVTFQHRNLFGAAEQLNLGAAVTQLGGGSASRGAGYNVTAALLKPDFLVRDQSLTGSLQAVKENLEAYDRTAFIGSITLSRRFSKVWTASAGLLATQSRVKQEGTTRDYTLLGVPFGLRYDTTGVEGVLEPTRGVRAAAVATPTQTLTGESATFAILQLSGSTYLDLAAPGRTILALRGLIGSVQGASTFELPPDQRFYAGGGGTVRGYKYQSIGPLFPSGRPTGGTSILTGTVELRQRIGESYGAAVFVDAGTVGDSSAPGTGDLRVGAGIGARYYTAIGPLRLDVAVPLDKRRKDDILQVYIGIGQAF